MDLVLQIWGGLFYLTNKICFALAEGKEKNRKRQLKIFRSIELPASLNGATQDMSPRQTGVWIAVLRRSSLPRSLPIPNLTPRRFNVIVSWLHRR